MKTKHKINIIFFLTLALLFYAGYVIHEFKAERDTTLAHLCWTV